MVFLAYDKELCGRHFLFCSKIWQELWSTGARSPSTHYILRVRYTHNTGASIIANRKKENLPPLGYCLCLQSTPFSAFSSLFGKQPEIRLRSHVNRKWSFCMFACGGLGGGGVLLIHSLTWNPNDVLSTQPRPQGFSLTKWVGKALGTRLLSTCKAISMGLASGQIVPIRNPRSYL